MNSLTAAWLVALTVAAPQPADISTREANRIQDAAAVLEEIHGIPDKDIPDELWDRAECVIVSHPSRKRPLFGGEYGKGLMSCRHDGAWGARIFHADRDDDKDLYGSTPSGG
jgi:lipid-binding SYLF domain-containing protein